MKRPTVLTITLLLSLLAACAGCGGGTDFLSAARYQNGLIVILDGAGGITSAPQQIRDGLDQGGVDQALEVFKWTAGHDVLKDQVDLERNRQMAGQLARRIADYVAEHPNSPVHLIAVSAGTGLAIFAIEQLPPGTAVDGVVLLASSLSAGYDLAPALRRVRYQVTNFSSIMDVGVLGLGVGLAGTVDRGPGPPAGTGGFHPPVGAAAEVKDLYAAKVREVPWNPAYMVEGHLGHHLGAASTAFVRRHIAPIIVEDARHRASQAASQP